MNDSPRLRAAKTQLRKAYREWHLVDVAWGRTDRKWIRAYTKVRKIQMEESAGGT
jgi:hypothetical protein